MCPQVTGAHWVSRPLPAPTALCTRVVCFPMAACPCIRTSVRARGHLGSLSRHDTPLQQPEAHTWARSRDLLSLFPTWPDLGLDDPGRPSWSLRDSGPPPPCGCEAGMLVAYPALLHSSSVQVQVSSVFSGSLAASLLERKRRIKQLS